MNQHTLTKPQLNATSANALQHDRLGNGDTTTLAWMLVIGPTDLTNRQVTFVCKEFKPIEEKSEILMVGASGILVGIHGQTSIEVRPSARDHAEDT